MGVASGWILWAWLVSVAVRRYTVQPEMFAGN